MAPGQPGRRAPARRRTRSAAARELAAVSSRALAGPVLPEWLAPIGLVVPGQLLTEQLSRTLGIDPDNPRGLSKVTQTA